MKPENSGLEQPGISLWTKFCTREAFLNLISGVWLRARRTMCYGKFMKGLMEIIWELDHSSTRSSVQGTIGQLSKQMRKFMSKYVTNANDSVMSPDNHQNTSPRWCTMTLCTMGTRHFGSLSTRHKADEVSSGGYWLFHQMGGGWTVSKYHTT